MSRYEDGHPSRGRTAEYYTYSGGVASPPAYSQQPSPGHTTYGGKPQARLTYEPQGSYHPSRSESHSRPRSQVLPIDSLRDGTRGRGDRRYSDSGDSEDDRVRSPIGKAKKFVDSTFTDSTTGLGVSVLGALVGGLAAREAVDLTSNRQQHHHRQSHDDDAEHRRNQLISTMVGAAVGALGANAVEKRIEARRARDEVKQERWERSRWRRPEGDEPEVIEQMEVVARPRSRDRNRDYSRSGRYKGEVWDERDRDRDRERDHNGDGDDYEDYGDYDSRRRGSRSRRGIEREVDPEAHSWKTVDDWRRGLTP